MHCQSSFRLERSTEAAPMLCVLRRASRHAAMSQRTCRRPPPLSLRTLPHSRSRTFRGAATCAAVPASAQQAAVHQHLQTLLGTAPSPVLMDLPNPLTSLRLPALPSPNLLSVLSFLLSHPLITFVLALFLYWTIPRLWRAFIKWVVVPASFLAAGAVVVKNPQTFSNAGSFVSGFTHDHPYVTSGVILVSLTLVLSPYLLTSLLVVLLATGIPRLPAPLQRLLPAPIVEVEQQLANISDATRGPVNIVKGKAAELGSSIQERGGRLLQNQFPALKETPALKAPPPPTGGLASTSQKPDIIA